MPDAPRRRGSRWKTVGWLFVALLWGGAIFAFATPRVQALLGAGDATDAALLGVGRQGAPDFADPAGAPGVNLGAAELKADRLPAALAALDAGGVWWLRLRVPWNEVEGARGQYEWADWDRVFGAIASRPMLTPVVVLDGSPEWARAPIDAGNPLAPPHERADYGAFVAAFALRYGEHVRHYQLWDEPNISPHWGARPVDPAGYAGLLREGAAQIRAVDPDAHIVLAALAPTTEGGGSNLSDVAYLDALYEQGAAPWFDAAAAQPYGFGHPPGDAPNVATLNFARIALLRQVMVRRDDDGKSLWVASFGWNAPAAAAGDSVWGQVPPAAQAQHAGEALDMARARWPWLGPMFWAAFCPAPDDPKYGFALCAPLAGAAPNGATWRALTSAATTPATLPPGSHATNHPALRYGDGWRVTPAAADPAEGAAPLVFDFYGASLDLRIQGGPFWGFYRVSVDGQPAPSLPRDADGSAYLVLHDPLAEARTVNVARGLAPDVHRAELTPHGGWGQWALQGIVVGLDPAPPGNAWRWLLALALLGIVGMLSMGGASPSGVRAGRLVSALSSGLDRLTAQPGPWLWVAAAALGVALALSRWLVLDLALLAALGLLFVIRPDLSLPLIAFSIPLWPHPKPILRWNITHYELFLLLGVAGCVVRWLLSVLAGTSTQRTQRSADERRETTRRASRFFRSLGLHSLDYPVLALVLVGLVSALAAENGRVALREWRAVFLLGGVFYFLVTRTPAWSGGRRAFSPWPLLNGLLLGMTAVSAFALWQLVTGQGRIDVEGVWRVRAFYGSPNNLALVLDRAVPLALALALFGAGRPRAERAWYAAAAVLTASACVATFSKGALFLGLPVGLAVVLIGGAFRTRDRRPLWLLAAAVVLALLSLPLLFQTPRFAGLFDFGSGTSFIRLRLWQGSLAMALDHPVLGVGPDNFLYAYRTRYVLPAAWEELNLSHPHNILLDLWTRIGLLGVTAAAWAFIGALRRAWIAMRHTDGEYLPWPVALGLLGALGATLAHGLIDNSLFLIDLMALFMLTLALLSRRKTPPHALETKEA